MVDGSNPKNLALRHSYSLPRKLKKAAIEGLSHDELVKSLSDDEKKVLDGASSRVRFHRQGKYGYRPLPLAKIDGTGPAQEELCRIERAGKAVSKRLV